MTVAPLKRLNSIVVALSLLGFLAGCAGDDTDEPQGSMPSPRSIPAGTASIEPGTYFIPKSAWSAVDFTVTFPKGWTVQYGHNYLKHSDAKDELGFYAVGVDEVFVDACKGGEETTNVGPGINDLAEALLKQPGARSAGRVKDTLGGYPAIRIDLVVPKNVDLQACRLEGAGLQVWYSAPADKYFVLLPDGYASVYIVDVDGQRQVFLVQHRSAASRSDLRELRAVLDSIQIEQ